MIDLSEMDEDGRMMMLTIEICEAIASITLREGEAGRMTPRIVEMLRSITNHTLGQERRRAKEKARMIELERNTTPQQYKEAHQEIRRSVEEELVKIRTQACT